MKIEKILIYLSKELISKFDSQALENDLRSVEKKLVHEFRRAAEDEDLNAEFEIWDSCAGDGIDETNEYKTL